MRMNSGDYKIVHGYSSYALDQSVNNELSQGFVPSGEIKIVPNDTSQGGAIAFYQVMIRTQ